MWEEYVRSLYPKANIEFSKGIKCPCVNMDTNTISIPLGFPEGIMTRAVVKHELGHLLFTKKTFGAVAKEEKIKPNTAIAELTNAIEDIREEKCFGADYLGIKQDFEELSKTVFSKIKKLPMSLSGLGMLTSYFLNFGILPTCEVEENLLKFFNKEKADLYTKFLDLKDVNGSARLAKELLEKFEKQFGEQPESSQSEKGQGEAKEGKGEKGESEKADGEGEGTGEKVGEENDVVIEVSGGVAEKRKEMYGDDKIQPSIHEQIKKYIEKETEIKGHYFSEDYNYSNCGKNIILDKEKLDNKFRYLSEKRITGIDGQVLKIRQILLGWLTDEARNRTLRMMKNGKLSSRDLFRVKTEKEPKIFKKKIMGKSNSVDLEILIDHSGSMRGNSIDTALKMAYVFNEALKNIKQVNYEITGFTTPSFSSGIANTLDNLFYVYKRFGEKANALTKKLLSKALTYTDGSHMFHNNDYEAIEYAEKQLARQSNNRKILFVISDGSPAVGFCSSMTLNTLTRKKIKELRKKGYEVYGFGIYVNLQDLYEENFVEVNDIKKLASIVSEKLLKVVRK